MPGSPGNSLGKYASTSQLSTASNGLDNLFLDLTGAPERGRPGRLRVRVHLQQQRHRHHAEPGGVAAGRRCSAAATRRRFAVGADPTTPCGAGQLRAAGGRHPSPSRHRRRHHVGRPVDARSGSAWPCRTSRPATSWPCGSGAPPPAQPGSTRSPSTSRSTHYHNGDSMSRISAYTSLAAAQSDDLVPVVDVHDTTMASSGTTKQITVAALLNGQSPFTLTDAATILVNAAQARVQRVTLGGQPHAGDAIEPHRRPDARDRGDTARVGRPVHPVLHWSI